MSTRGIVRKYVRIRRPFDSVKELQLLSGRFCRTEPEAHSKKRHSADEKGKEREKKSLADRGSILFFVRRTPRNKYPVTTLGGATD